MKDNYDLWEEHDAKQEAWLETLPVCSECGEPIQDEKLIDIDGELYHVACFMSNFLKWAEDYTG